MNKKDKIIKSLDLIKESWTDYKKSVLKFIEVFVYGLVGVIPLFAILLLALIYGTTGLAQSAAWYTNLILGIIAFILFLVSIYFAIVYSIRTMVASILLLKNNFSSAKESFKEAKPYIVKYLAVSLLVVVLTIAWFYAFVIPALIFAVYYGFAQYVLVAEDKRPFSAVERSYDLVRGYWWPVFGRLVLLVIIGMVIYALISSPLFLMIDGSLPAFTYGIFINLIWAALFPYFLIYSFKLYESLKEKNK